MQPIITSLLDTDWYKFTMAQAALAKFSTSNAQYNFTCRNKDQKLGYLVEDLTEQIRSYAQLRFTQEELDYLRSIPGMQPFFIDALRQLDLSDVEIDVSGHPVTGDLNLRIYGPWFKSIWFEVPILAIINELHSFKRHGGTGEGYDKVLEDKIQFLSDYNTKRSAERQMKFIEFGTRRRYSQAVQKAVFERLMKTGYCLGTSNVALAKAARLRPIGTMAHEWIQAGQALTHPLDSQVFMLKAWTDVYGSLYNIALTDTMTSKKFLVDCEVHKLDFSGFRQDSGDPVEWTNDLLTSLKRRGIDPRTKTAVYSDSLSFLSATEMHTEWEQEFKSVLFGIGTDLTNDVPGHKALNIVIKLTMLNDRPVAKISDIPTKAISISERYLGWLREEIELETESHEPA